MKYTSHKISDNQIKYHFKFDDGKLLSWNNFIKLLSEESQELINALNDANVQLKGAYFWECPPISKDTLNRTFEFVVTKSESLDNIKQNYSSFNNHLSKGNSVFTSRSGAILIIPRPEKNESRQELDYKNLANFVQNAPNNSKATFWLAVAGNLKIQLVDGKPRWLSTHGLGVHYLHVRIDKQPIYYSFDEYKEFKEEDKKPQTDDKEKDKDTSDKGKDKDKEKTPAEPALNNGDRGNYNPKNHSEKSEKGNETEKNKATDNSPNNPSEPNKIDNFNELKKKVLQNLDKVSFDQVGHPSNAEILKDPNVDSLKLGKSPIITQIKIDGETINLREFEKPERDKDFLEIRNAIINSIKQNISEWEIKKDKKGQNFLENQKTGQKVWEIIFAEPIFKGGKKDWTEIESAIKNSDSSSKVSKSSSASENGKPEKKEFPWKIVLPVGAILVFLLGIIIFSLTQKSKKKKILKLYMKGNYKYE